MYEKMLNDECMGTVTTRDSRTATRAYSRASRARARVAHFSLARVGLALALTKFGASQLALALAQATQNQILKYVIQITFAPTLNCNQIALRKICDPGSPLSP